ncbi:uncharacterized protein LOC144581998 [Callithrix jacchus]
MPRFGTLSLDEIPGLAFSSQQLAPERGTCTRGTIVTPTNYRGEAAASAPSPIWVPERLVKHEFSTRRCKHPDTPSSPSPADATSTSSTPLDSPSSSISKLPDFATGQPPADVGPDVPSDC